MRFLSHHPTHSSILFGKRKKILVDDLAITHYSIIYYMCCIGRWFLFIMIRANGDLARRHSHHCSYCWEGGKSIFFFLYLSLALSLLPAIVFFFFFFVATQRTNVSLSKKCWSTRMFVISFQRTHGLHIYTCSNLGKKQSSKERTYIHTHTHIRIKDRPSMRVTKVSAVM